jgi:hypothetical protein
MRRLRLPVLLLALALAMPGWGMRPRYTNNYTPIVTRPFNHPLER